VSEELRRQELSFANIAEKLNEAGFRPAKRAEKLYSDIVSRLARKLENLRPGERTAVQWWNPPLPAELTIPGVASKQ
jgi:hypothetical protein